MIRLSTICIKNCMGKNNMLVYCLLFYLLACTRPSVPVSEFHYGMSDSTFHFKPWLIHVIDSFVERNPGLEYNMYVNKINQDTVQIALQGTVSGGMRMGEERMSYDMYPLTRYYHAETWVDVYSGGEMLVRPKEDSIGALSCNRSIDMGEEELLLLYVIKDSVYFYEGDADIYPFTEHRFHIH